MSTNPGADKPLVPAAKLYFPDEDRKWILEQIDQVLASGQLTLGKHGKELERRWAEYCGTKYAVAVNSGTSSIEIPLRAFGVAGKDVICPTNTFFATAAGIEHAGGIPVLADMDPDYYSLTVKEIEKRLTPNTVGVVIVHIGGFVTPHINDIVDFCKKKGIWLFEDAAHAHGSSYKGVKAGKFGRASSFSFYPTKVMTSGEGGIIATDDEFVYNEALIYRDQGKASFTVNAHTRLGYNWRMSEIHAVIGLKQLDRLEFMISERQRAAKAYDAAFRDDPLAKPMLTPAGGVANYYKYLLIPKRPLKDRKAMKMAVREKYNVGLTGEVYEEALHKQPIFKNLDKGNYPNADEGCARHICLPLFPGITDEMINRTIEGVKWGLKEYIS
jgi:dTDP-4-amino-4,6-dideoxygalactose transaminase